MKQRHGLQHVCEKCGRFATFYRVTRRRAYSCGHCGYEVHPCAGTPLHGSHTNLWLWFYAYHLLVRERRTAGTTELQRWLGVTYKVARRMLCKISEMHQNEISNILTLESYGVPAMNSRQLDPLAEIRDNFSPTWWNRVWFRRPVSARDKRPPWVDGERLLDHLRAQAEERPEGIPRRGKRRERHKARSGRLQPRRSL